MDIHYPLKVLPVLRGRSRYKVLRGGRGSAKSWSIAKHLVIRANQEPLRILCTRELQNSIRDSVHRLIADKIIELGLQSSFSVKTDSIRSSAGAEFIFRGLRHSISEIKSMEGIDIVWVEEAERVSEDSWSTLIPTIRKDNSEILVTFNPESDQSPTYKRFVLSQPPDCQSAEVNYWDNPWFPETLRREMEYDRRVDPDKYLHVWCGKTKKYSEALIFRGKVRVEDFETPPDMRFYYGADWGFSNDPSCLVRMFILERKLYIDWEAYAVGIELDDLPRFFDTVPKARYWKITADSQRPDTISFMSRQGFDMVGAEKGKGSVEDGITFLRGFEEIIIHPRCPGAKDNFFNYKWKVDRITGAVLPIPADGSDHIPDACRYALEDYIKANVTIFDVLHKPL